MIILNVNDLYDLLDADNQAGGSRYTCFPARDDNGVPFLASLADDGDSAHIEIIVPDSTGRSTCNQDCPECGCESINWEPQYPIKVLS